MASAPPTVDLRGVAKAFRGPAGPVHAVRGIDLAHPGRFRPFMGVGGTLRNYSPSQGNGDTKLGINLVSGTRIALSSSRGYEPFIMGQYSIVRDQLNSFSVVVGASFRLRDEVYAKSEEEKEQLRGKAEVIIAKQRHGPTGSVPLGFQGEFTRFFDLAEDHHLPERYE